MRRPARWPVIYLAGIGGSLRLRAGLAGYFRCGMSAG